MNLLNAESYITPILLSYVDKYVRDFKPADAQVSLWDGGVTLNNLVLKPDVLQKEVALPFTLVSGRIHELLIHVPWTKILSEPIVITINTIECILSLDPPPQAGPSETVNNCNQVVEAPTGYIQVLVRRIVSNISIRVHSLIVKYVHDDVILSLTIKHLSIDSVGQTWQPTFADIDQDQPVVRRLVRVEDLTICLDKSDSDGKIRSYHEPLIYRCQLELRLLTHLVSANTRRARNINIQLLCSKLACDLHSEQLILLLRLLREHSPAVVDIPPPAQASAQALPAVASTSNAPDPVVNESWSDWAWSWLPTWMDREGVEETTSIVTPARLAFFTYIDQITLAFRITETDAANRKRRRSICELIATDAVIKCTMRSPTFLHLKMGARNLTLTSHGICACGNLDNTNSAKPTIYLEKIENPEEEPWSWVEEELINPSAETGAGAAEEIQDSPYAAIYVEDIEEDADLFWQKMKPAVYLEYNHDRSPPFGIPIPYDKPIRDFEYSDWEEQSILTISIKPMLLNMSNGLVHRLAVIQNAIREVPPVVEEVQKRTLTVEECDALSENLPQRHINFELGGLRLRILPTEHSERLIQSPLVLDVQIARTTLHITGPLYPHRVCSAACQLPEDSAPLFQGARLHMSVHIGSIRIGICLPDSFNPRHCATADLKLVTHTLLNKPLFNHRESVQFKYTLKIMEVNVCGSSPRLQAALHVIMSFIKGRLSRLLRETTLAQDALCDKKLVALDTTLENFTGRGYLTKYNNAHFISFSSVKITALKSSRRYANHAWICCGPESPSICSYTRCALQYCNDPLPSMIEYFSLMIGPTAINFDALLVSWLSYQPQMKSFTDLQAPSTSYAKPMPSYVFKRKGTPPSSCGRGGSRSGSGAELVHVRQRSLESESEASEKREEKTTVMMPEQRESWFSDEMILKIYSRLNRLLLTIEIGLVQVYMPSAMVPAVDSITIRESMERHVSKGNRVLVLSFGHLSVFCSAQMQYLWDTIKPDQPTYFRPQRETNVIEDSFPWKIRLVDIYCYTLEVKADVEFPNRERLASGLKSQLKTSRVVLPRPVLDMVTSTITVAVVTKCLPSKPVNKEPSEQNKEDDNPTFFAPGSNFQPTSLEEFLRGRSRWRNLNAEGAARSSTRPSAPKNPVVSLGVHLYADTPPLVLKVDQDQLKTVTVAIHGLLHILNLLLRPPVTRQAECSSSSSHRPLERSTSEMEAGPSSFEETTNDNKSEPLVSIYQSQQDPVEEDTSLKIVFWAQWVISQVNLSIFLPEAKIVLNLEDIMTTVDLQGHYRQLKIKVASASLKHYKKPEGCWQWTPGLYGGRILEGRDPVDFADENNFLSVTITQTRISNLPASWKQSLHPKFFELYENIDTMWEIYSTFAPMDIAMQPDLLELLMFWFNELMPKNYCSLKLKESSTSASRQLPFCYVYAGGFRILLNYGEENTDSVDDTIMCIINSLKVTPYPENPICRQYINDTWNMPRPDMDERQYEIIIKQISFRTAQYSQLVDQEATESENGNGGENPALKWGQQVVSPSMTPFVHPFNISILMAPAIFSNGTLVYGSVIEVNVPTDCLIELAVERLELVYTLASHFIQASTSRTPFSYFSEKAKTCPFKQFIESQKMATSPAQSETAVSEEATDDTEDASRQPDSGFETATSQSTYKLHREPGGPAKKSVSIACHDKQAKASDYLELSVTTGVVNISLYVRDDGSPEVKELRPPPGIFKKPAKKEVPRLKVIIEDPKEENAETSKDEGKDSACASKSLTENAALPHASKTEGNIPLVHVTLESPNFLYSKKKKDKTIQISVFNAWVGLGSGQEENHWNAPLFRTERGSPDPINEVPPALATLRVEYITGSYLPLSNTSGRGTVNLEVERPILLEVSSDRLRRIKGIKDLIERNTSTRSIESSENTEKEEEINPSPLLYKIRSYFVYRQIDSVTVLTDQIGVQGPEGAVGWSSLQLQATAGSHPDRLSCRALVNAFVVSAGPPTDQRRVVLSPLVAGALLEATFEAWRKAEGGLAAQTPSIRVAIDADQIIMDLRPSDIAAVNRIYDAMAEIMGWPQRPSTPESSSAGDAESTSEGLSVSNESVFIQPNATSSDSDHHYYKDDLRSGAFQIMSGGQLPMAYQVTLHGNTVSWRYPHPRAVTRIVALPIPGQTEKEVECALEVYCPLLARWEPYTYFKLPVTESREIQLNSATPDAIFSLTWRVRICSDVEGTKTKRPFEFDPNIFSPISDPLAADEAPASDNSSQTCTVTAEQLSGILRVDSYFAPSHMPTARIALRFANLEIVAHNELPSQPRADKPLEGYYVSKPLMRSHRVLTLSMRDTAAQAILGESSRLLFDTFISSNIINSATGSMEQLIEEFRMQGTVSLDNEQRLMLRAGDIRAALYIPRMCTLQALAHDWINVYKSVLKLDIDDTQPEDAAAVLEGRVSLWIHNNCSSALFIGQEETDELVPLSGGASLAYRWRSPTAPKKLRFSIASQATDWRWSNSITFSDGSYRVRLEQSYVSSDIRSLHGTYLYVAVKDAGVRRDMYLSGEITLANMLRHNMLYKVRVKRREDTVWQTLSCGDFNAESIGCSVLCNTEYESTLKLKYKTSGSGWSGDIPLKECRKENMPWLVKLPSSGEVNFTSVWCRVNRARADGRIIATIWPFYSLRSHLPLDADVTVTSRTPVDDEGNQVQQNERQPPLIQMVTGRGATTHLIAPGTTATTHALTFQYSNIDCPVTLRAVPLHYGVTESSVFEKPTPITTNIEEIIEALKEWLEKAGRDVHSNWPYSIVTKHWPGTWHPALLQPRSDVNMRYQAVRIGGGCSLELQVCPVVLLANASPVALTLRGHDSTPLCRLEPGVALSPQTHILHKPFFLSMEMGREIFVSSQLKVCKKDHGQYGNPPPGHIALDRAAKLAIHCGQKVALLTMCYEIKEDINVLGVTSTYILINRLPTDIVVTPMVVPRPSNDSVLLRPKMFKVIEPTKEESLQGTPLCSFWMRGRWRETNAEEIRTYLCIALPSHVDPTASHVPVRLDQPPIRRSIALRQEKEHSIAAVVTQVRHESRWVITVAEDPCPQFVVRNRTANSLAIAQPTLAEPGQANVQPVGECFGVRWFCEVEAGGSTHYSTPDYCNRYPSLEIPCRPPIPFLTVGQKSTGEFQYQWSQPVAIADGEHLLQMAGGVTIKVHVCTNPHSTLVELLDVDQHDISASDIRRRLLGVSDESPSLQEDNKGNSPSNQEVRRASAYENLMDAYDSPRPSTSKENEDVALLPVDTQTGVPSASEVEHGQPGTQNVEEVVMMTAQDASLKDSSFMKLSTAVQNDIAESYKSEKPSVMTVARELSTDYSEDSQLLKVEEKEWSRNSQIWNEIDRLRCVVGSITLTLGASADTLPLVAIHLQRAAIRVQSDSRKVRTTVSVADLQVDNTQYSTDLFDFAVVAATREVKVEPERWPPLWGMYNEVFPMNSADARLLMHTCHDKWTVAGCSFQELTEVEIKLGPLGLYIEDAFIAAIIKLLQVAVPAIPQTSEMVAIAESRSLQQPLRFRKFLLHPLDLTLTLHTAVRIYIALDESPLHLNKFLLQDVMTSSAKLTHALTVHYLSAALLGAGWVVGGLELLGAPGALAARVGNAGGGVRGVASAAAGALLRSLSAAAGSLARNLDLLAGDDDHARRAAAARRRPPSSLMAGLMAGITNFAINILGAVGGLAHHPLVGPAVGESGSGATGLRRGILGAITKPLSATADLVAYAGHGLLSQTGWDPVPQPRLGGVRSIDQEVLARWRCDCVRWSFRLPEMTVLAGFDVLIKDRPTHLLVTNKCLVLVDPETDLIAEMIDFKTCTLSRYQGHVIELNVIKKKPAKTSESQNLIEEIEYQVNMAAMARVARYTGVEFYFNNARVLAIRTQPGKSHTLFAALSAALQHNNASHFPLL